jgi:hypothetical protein
MGDAKSIIVKPISSQDASTLIKKVHYSGKVAPSSALHLGVFYKGKLHGAMQFGTPLDKRKVIGLVEGTEWNQMMELNRMAFDEHLPRNSESRAMAVAFRMLKKHRPDIKWILSFSDATQCGDGTIYRAAGFVLTQINRNVTLIRLPSGEVVANLSLRKSPLLRKKYDYRLGVESESEWRKRIGVERMHGYQLRYIKFLDESWRERLACPVIPFSEIPRDVRMYKGERVAPVAVEG